MPLRLTSLAHQLLFFGSVVGRGAFPSQQGSDPILGPARYVGLTPRWKTRNYHEPVEGLGAVCGIRLVLEAAPAPTEN